MEQVDSKEKETKETKEAPFFFFPSPNWISL
jgi:hypothetical protein